LQELDPWPDAGDCLASLRDAGHPLYVLTNSSVDTAHGLLDRAGLSRFFTEVCSVDEVRAAKPHPAPYLRAMERAGCRPEQSVLIAAHAWDVVGAAELGMQTVWISRLEKRWPLPGRPPGAVAATLGDAARQVPAA
jgi:2-haloacid dehalogenase